MPADNQEHITEALGNSLLLSARNTIAAKLGADISPGSDDLSDRIKGGLFVTLYLNGRLRGCIGSFDFTRPLKQAVKDMAQMAAFSDPRFHPLTKEEWPEIKLELSILTPLKKIKTLDEIEIGTHGLYLAHPWGQGVLLPQVALEYGWDKETFARQTSKKAGLPAEFWQDKQTVLSSFTALIFKE